MGYAGAMWNSATHVCSIAASKYAVSSVWSVETSVWAAESFARAMVASMWSSEEYIWAVTSSACADSASVHAAQALYRLLKMERKNASLDSATVRAFQVEVKKEKREKQFDQFPNHEKRLGKFLLRSAKDSSTWKEILLRSEDLFQ